MPVPADPHPSFQDYAHPERVVSASWLSARIGVPGLRIVESDEDSLLYDIGHVPGAVRIDWQRDLNDPISRDFIDGAGFAALMRSKGIARDDTVVIYGDKSNGWAAYTLWVFQLFGHKDVRLLDGGRDAWMAEERDTSFTVPDYPATDYPVVERHDAPARAFVDEVLGAACSDKTMLIDVRGIDQYTGDATVPAEKTALRAGHIPTAINIPWENAIYPNNNFRTRAELERQYHSLEPDQPTVVYSHLGDRSAHTWFVLKYLLGFNSVRNYDGSWSEWGNMVRMPITIDG
ncbi:sulfurtransferase [Corynebacterium lowii]|uniref:Sulfurtransferase n=1 Tax=Corynebacterium lowii TaxID=1544413 RepID=A0A0Q1AKN1_9CORY|nr:sulfurtransferase [Corynebacterium lowii]KQB87517.1 putative thiosulfate sulfurtransferase SseA [Corynebacterium lowii]MDP9851888.1 thiosulfate/3-mercaptopyruvate sulfurtransferase [Corynebacterium lowii]